jgi:hypothetical protein
LSGVREEFPGQSGLCFSLLEGERGQNNQGQDIPFKDKSPGTHFLSVAYEEVTILDPWFIA